MKASSQVKRRRLTRGDKIAMFGMGAYAFADAFLLAKHWYDWTTAIFFEVPLVFVGRALWDTIKIGKDGIELSVGAEAADSADIIDDYVAGVQDRDARAKILDAETPPGAVVESQSVTGEASGVQAGQTGEAHASVTSATLGFAGNLSAVKISPSQPPPPSDPLLAAAQVRINIERELRRMAMLSGLMRPDQNFAVGLLRKLLSRNELFPEDVSGAIDRIVKIANAMLHGADVSNADKDDLYDSGMRAVLSLTELTQTSSWLSQAIYVRAQKLGLDPRRTYTFFDVEGDVYVGDLRFDILRGADRITDKKALAVIAVTPPPVIVAKLLASELCVAWVDDDRFQGTESARASAPWLVSSAA